ncbi:MAG: hypothetical protein AB7S26_16465 [Sandaracinaceae bacterium]
MGRRLVLPLGMLCVIACNARSPERASLAMERGRADASIVRWVAGTPTYAYADHYVEQHRIASELVGPWDAAVLELRPGVRLQPGFVHRARLTPARRSVGAMRLVVVEVLETRRGGPPTTVHPGRAVAGINLGDVAERDGARWGPFHLERDAIVFRLADVGPVLVDGRALAPRTALAGVARAFDGCVALPSDEVVCRGARLRAIGADVEIAVSQGSVDPLAEGPSPSMLADAR